MYIEEDEFEKFETRLRQFETPRFEPVCLIRKTDSTFKIYNYGKEGDEFLQLVCPRDGEEGRKGYKDV